MQNHSQLLRKETVIKLIWEKRVGEEGNLPQYIFTLRKLFGENPQDHRFIVTIPGKGFRFVASVIKYSGKRRDSEIAPSSGIKIRSLAVLPIIFLDSHGEDKFLGLALADSLVTRLSPNSRITIRPAASILKFANTEEDPSRRGRELGVDAVASGAMIRAGDRINLTVQLAGVGGREISGPAVITFWFPSVTTK